MDDADVIATVGMAREVTARGSVREMVLAEIVEHVDLGIEAGVISAKAKKTLPKTVPLSVLFASCLATVSMAKLAVRLADELDALKAANAARKN